MVMAMVHEDEQGDDDGDDADNDGDDDDGCFCCLVMMVKLTGTVLGQC